jgi:hypothetical protein
MSEPLLYLLPQDALLLGGATALGIFSYSDPELAPLALAGTGAAVAYVLSQVPIITPEVDGKPCRVLFAGEACEREELRIRRRNVALAALAGVVLGVAYRESRR